MMFPWFLFHRADRRNARLHQELSDLSRQNAELIRHSAILSVQIQAIFDRTEKMAEHVEVMITHTASLVAAQEVQIEVKVDDKKLDEILDYLKKLTPSQQRPGKSSSRSK